MISELIHAFFQAALGTAFFMTGYLLAAIVYVRKGHQW